MKLFATTCGAVLLSTAAGQQAGGASITDILADAPSATQTGPSTGHIIAGSSGTSSGSSGAAAPPMGGMGGIGAMLGAVAGGGKAASNKKDMFGRAPSGPFNPLTAMMGGGGPGGGASSGAAAPAPSANPLMDNLLNSVESRMPINGKMASKMGIKQPISQESQEIVSGVVGAFMHKFQLSDGEKGCLEKNLAHLTGDIVGTSEDIVKAVKAIAAGRAQPGSAQFNQADKAKSQGAMVSAGLDGGMKITSLITETTSLLKNCVKGDALKMLEETGQHFIDMKYISHRMLVSGVDIAHRLSDAIIAYEHQQWHRFGEDIGIAARKVLLSNSTRGSHLPEGVPEETIIQETTSGLMEGFFARGTGVEITDRAAPDVDIQLDLHRCIAGNHEFFKEVWLAMWNLIAEMAVSANNGHEFQNPFDQASGQSQPKWMGEIMVAMMQVPMALSRCNIDQESQQMMMQAIKSIQYLKVHFLFPHHQVTGDEATKRMAKAIEAWTNWNFQGFGREIGKLLQEFVVMMYPQKYSFDSNGRLRRQLDGENCKHCLKVGGLVLSAPMTAWAACAVVMSLFVALVAMRSARSMRGKYQEDAIQEASDSELLLE